MAAPRLNRNTEGERGRNQCPSRGRSGQTAIGESPGDGCRKGAGCSSQRKQCDASVTQAKLIGQQQRRTGPEKIETGKHHSLIEGTAPQQRRSGDHAAKRPHNLRIGQVRAWHTSRQCAPQHQHECQHHTGRDIEHRAPTEDCGDITGDWPREHDAHQQS